jgi:hypothetical protein
MIIQVRPHDMEETTAPTERIHTGNASIQYFLHETEKRTPHERKGCKQERIPLYDILIKKNFKI